MEGLDEDDFGSWDPRDRIIRIRPRTRRVVAHQVLQHEWVHAVLWDAGLHSALGGTLEEQVCDSIATALVASQLTTQ